MFNEREFRAALALAGISIPQMAKRLGISTATLYRKMRGTSDFTRAEIQIFTQETRTSDAGRIFFAREVS